MESLPNTMESLLSTLRSRAEFVVGHLAMGRNTLQPPPMKRTSRAVDIYIYGFNPWQPYRFREEDEDYMYFETLEDFVWTKAQWKLHKKTGQVAVLITHLMGNKEIYYEREEYEVFVKC